MELSNKLILDILNFKVQRILEIRSKIKPLMNIYSNKIPVLIIDKCNINQ